MMRMVWGVAVLILVPLLFAPAWAKEAVPTADNPVVEARLKSIASELRCLVCQNQTLADSEASLAEDFRREIREMIYAGLSDQEIIDFLVDRYGDFVRYRPPFKGTTLLLWFGPFLLAVTGVLLLVRTLRRRNAQLEDEPLSGDEERRVRELLKNNSGENRT
ncbi:MAG: cytochrome c-type biogenesis protein CcmH [Leptospirillia bacterium]